MPFCNTKRHIQRKLVNCFENIYFSYLHRMNKKIKTALISVFYKDGLDDIVTWLHQNGVVIYSTGGTRDYIEKLGIRCIPVEEVTTYPSILGGRVKTLHPALFGGILAKRDDDVHVEEMETYHIPEIDLVMVDLYPFEETVRSTSDENLIIEKIDIGGPSMIRAAAKNYKDVTVVASKKDYPILLNLLQSQEGVTTIEQRRTFAVKAFDVCTSYDTAISNYFHQSNFITPFNQPETVLRYGENPHQQATFYGSLSADFKQLHGKALSYNNLVDVEAALQLMSDFAGTTDAVFAIIKHTNVCGVAQRSTTVAAWKAALEGDPESAFGGVLISNRNIDAATARLMNELFFEVLLAPGFEAEALTVLQAKKNRILLQTNEHPFSGSQYRTLLGGLLVQDYNQAAYETWNEVGGVETTATQQADLKFANIICKHLKSNAIALVKNGQLVGKGCGQTSRVDALRHAIAKARQFNLDLQDAVMASDAFFPFSDCVQIGHEAGVRAFIQPGGSIRDEESVEYCKQHHLAMVMTSTRHFKH